MIRVLALVAALALAGAAGHAEEPPRPEHARFTARVASLELRDDAVAAEIFYTVYRAANSGPQRPLSFVFNGGPGAASAFLQLGGIGPDRVAANDNGSLPAGALQITPNAQSWLDLSDLVFVDPVGTGWSRPLGDPDTTPFWGADQDARWMGRFVRAYLARFPAEGRAIHLVGESYGGYRVIRLAQELSRDRIDIAGLVMISPVIDFAMLGNDGPYDLLATVSRLPSYAAAAWAHGHVGQAPRTEDARAAFLAEVERFAIAEYLPALAQGDGLPARDTAQLYAHVAEVTGLPLELVTRWRGRIPRTVFANNLLANDNRVVGLYDASIAAMRQRGVTDPSFGAMIGQLDVAANGYFIKTLGVNRPDYELLNRRAAGSWDYVGRRRGLVSPPVGSTVLADLLTRDPRLRVLIANGRHDLITAYFSTVMVLRQLALPDAARARVTHVITEGGHMMYFNAAARAALFEQARAHYATVVRAP